MMPNQGSSSPAMDQKIFQMGLSVEEISLYLLCCGLADIGKPITYNNLLEIWTSDEASLAAGLQVLENRHIITRYLSEREVGRAFALTDSQDWKDG